MCYIVLFSPLTAVLFLHLSLRNTVDTVMDTKIRGVDTEGVGD